MLKFNWYSIINKKVLNEEDFAFTQEELEKINKLRVERDSRNQKDRLSINSSSIDWVVKNNDLVHIKLGGSEFIGKISKITISSGNEVYYTATTTHGIIKELTRDQISRRYYENLSNEEIPEKLKAISTYKLLSLLRSSYKSYGQAFLQGEYYTREQIKASLVGRTCLK